MNSIHKLQPDDKYLGPSVNPDEEMEIITKRTIERHYKMSKKSSIRNLKRFTVCVGMGLVLIIVAQAFNVIKYWLVVGGIVFILTSLLIGYYYRKDLIRARRYEDLLKIIEDQNFIKKPGITYDIWKRLKLDN